MDLAKIGKYLAAKRKALGLTQRQVADKLGMSDKSVSKWERGICLPDVSVYGELCEILGISLNEFLAGEDLEKEEIEQKSEENIIGISTDSKHKQNRLKKVIALLLVVFVLAGGIGAFRWYRANRPQNRVTPMAADSVEQKTINLLTNIDGGFLFQYETTGDVTGVTVYITEYHYGKKIAKSPVTLHSEPGKKSNRGSILIVPDFETFQVKVILADETGKLSTSYPLLAGAKNPDRYARVRFQLEEQTVLTPGEEQGLVGILCGKKGITSVGMEDLLKENTEEIKDNEYTYFFSLEFDTK